jgi:hypothetical protein
MFVVDISPQVFAFFTLLALLVQTSLAVPQFYGDFNKYPIGRHHGAISQRAIAVANPFQAVAEAVSDNFASDGALFPSYPLFPAGLVPFQIL